jgi:hydroxylamine reductase
LTLVKIDMFCFQCEQTKDGIGCTSVGVCGKTAETAALQDYLIHQLKVRSYDGIELNWTNNLYQQGISAYASRLRQFGITDPEIDRFTLESLFSTLTNVNFDSER